VSSVSSHSLMEKSLPLGEEDGKKGEQHKGNICIVLITQS